MRFLFTRARYEGTHDFRNICKMDVGNGVLQFQRTILSASVKPLQPQQISSADQYELFVFEIKGLAFLYHQVPIDSVLGNSSCSSQAIVSL